MATLDATAPRPALMAASDALEAAIDASLAGVPRHPSGTTFVPADLELRDVARPYVVVDAEGNQKVQPARDTRLLVVLALTAAAAVAWLVSRRPD